MRNGLLRSALGALVGLVCATACTQPQITTATPHEEKRGCKYDVTIASAEPLRLRVVAQCDAPRIDGFRAPQAESLPYFEKPALAGGALLPYKKGLFHLPAPSSHARIQYEVDLEGLAQQTDHFDSAQRFGEALVAPASSWLLEPMPVTPAVPVTLEVHTTNDVQFASGLRKAEGEKHLGTSQLYELEAHEIQTATYGIFGKFQRRELSVNGAELSLVFAPGKLAASEPALERWVKSAARIVSDFYGQFPVERAFVTVLPVPGRRGVVFGKVLPESSPGIALLVGEHTDESQLYDDWILVHELFHLGFPSFDGEGKWLDEGSATYFEPILRARAGWRREEDVWQEFVRDMPQGLRAVTGTGLERAQDYRGIYWGGAIMCLLADLRARQLGRPGLEEGFRAVLKAGGNASEVWSLKQTVSVLDDAIGAPVVHDLVARHAFSGAPVDLAALWKQLGISTSRRGVELSDSAPLAQVREALVFGDSGDRLATTAEPPSAATKSALRAARPAFGLTASEAVKPQTHATKARPKSKIRR